MVTGNAAAARAPRTRLLADVTPAPTRAIAVVTAPILVPLAIDYYGIDLNPDAPSDEPGSFVFK